MAASDLAILADVKTWLAGSSGIGSTDDALLSRLITDVSGAITAYLGRPSLTPRTLTERLDGNGRMRLFLSHYPVLQISSLAIDNVAIPAAAPPATGAPHPLGYLLEPWDGLPPGRPQALDLFELSFRRGRQNVVAAYSAGYAVEGEGATVPGAPGPYNVSVGAPFGPWASDAGVTYADGVALTAVAGTPDAGQYNVSSGVYGFAAADAGTVVLLSYGFIPAAINNACIEWVAERYRYRTRIGQSAQTVAGQQTASYSLKDIPDFIRASLDPYRSVVVG
ncbi:hypothetical protein [Bradyrhizobium sp.]|uniref:hypothetical protein n=1 Tax=Bradyrhizobium sp. TaxID=376 RepID=UPI003C4690CB